MASDDLSPEQLASVFAEFVHQVASAASHEGHPFLDRIQEHLGADPAQLPVTLEQFDTFDQPNLQLAIDEYTRQDGRSAGLFGVGVDRLRSSASAGRGPGRLRNGRPAPTTPRPSSACSLDGVDVAALADRTEGATPAYIKELLRKATLYSLDGGSGTVLRQADVDAALEDLAQGGRLAERILGFRPEPAGAPPPQMPFGPPQPSMAGVATGFPTQVVVKRDK